MWFTALILPFSCVTWQWYMYDFSRYGRNTNLITYFYGNILNGFHVFLPDDQDFSGKYFHLVRGELWHDVHRAAPFCDDSAITNTSVPADWPWRGRGQGEGSGEEEVKAEGSASDQTALDQGATLFPQSRFVFFSPLQINHRKPRCVSVSFKVAVHSFVENLFRSIWGLPNCRAPLAVKYFFDFLDCQADNMKIPDPDVLHIWKTNRWGTILLVL